jgi:hypothetical protein
MAWFDFWKKKPNTIPTEVSVAEDTPTQEQPIRVADFPLHQYKVYWETHLTQQQDYTWTAEVRFIGLDGYQHRSSYNLYGPTQENVESNVSKLIKEQMNNFRK